MACRVDKVEAMEVVSSASLVDDVEATLVVLKYSACAAGELPGCKEVIPVVAEAELVPVMSASPESVVVVAINVVRIS